MSSIAVTASATGTGTVSLVAPVTNSDRTVTLPDNTGTVLTTATAGVPVNGPAFRAFLSANQAVAHNTNTKIVFDGETFDTNSNFATGRFTPTVAGYYYIMSTVAMSQATQCIINIYKNGSIYLSGSPQTGWAGIAGVSGIVYDSVYCNGSTDYVEIYAYQATGTSQNAIGGTQYTTFSGGLIRGAQ
jgi:hypothetical protein